MSGNIVRTLIRPVIGNEMLNPARSPKADRDVSSRNAKLMELGKLTQRIESYGESKYYSQLVRLYNFRKVVRYNHLPDL